MKYDSERELKEQIDSKLNEVKKIIEADLEKKISVENESKAADKQDTFTERIQLQVIRNLELQIRNIHIRYEDDFSKPEHPFSAGITLDSIDVRV
jgi:vacuolar protein sorting-associated protein 13A/C